MFYGTKFMLEVIRVFQRAGYEGTDAQDTIWPSAAFKYYEKEGKRLKKTPKQAALITIASYFYCHSDISENEKQGIYAAAWAIAEADPEAAEYEEVLLKLASGRPLDDTDQNMLIKGP